MTNKEKIFEQLKNLTIEIMEDSNEKGVTAQQIASKLDLKRNVVSLHLNDLYREGKIDKINTRPVYYIFRERDLENENLSIDNKVNNNKCEVLDPFENLIGYNGSLKRQVEQCKVAASYPNNGLPVILTGESGVGKSYIAQLIYEYSKNNGYIEQDAPFIIFNCAEYANNLELLSSKLFGHSKGAFTGANNSSFGIIEEANNGYLFLDEVHRLSPEGQEKLFLILDKGIYQRLGENDKWRTVSIRFIFATTEDLQKILLETFMRRIPLNIKIPSFSERPTSEKLNFIYKLFRDEANKINLDIEVSKQVLNVLFSIKLNGNIGKLANIIKYSSAHAYTENLSSKNKCKRIFVKLNNLSQELLAEYYGNGIKKYNFNNMVISLKEKDFINEKVMNNKHIIDDYFIDLAKIAKQFCSNNMESENLTRELNVKINNIIDNLVFNKEEYESQDISVNVMTSLVEEGLKILENNYGIKYYGNATNILSLSLNYFWQNVSDTDRKEKKILTEAESVLKKQLPKYHMMATKLLNLIEVNIDYKFDIRAFIYVVYYLFIVNNKQTSMINSIIIAHGYSTASSIASVANKLLDDFIFEAFDMPIDISPKEITNKISKYLETIDTTKGLVILVDMGSLEEIYKSLLGKIKGDLAIINNITTQIALEVGTRIKQDHSINGIIDNFNNWNKISCRYIKYDNKKKYTILSTCISGIGTAVKIRDLLKKCINDENIEVIDYDFNKIQKNETREKIFLEHNVILIVGTSKLNIRNVPYMTLEEFITGRGDIVLRNVLENKLSKRTYEEISRDIVKEFSLENILNQLTILNPNKIISQVERVILDLERGVGKRFSNNLKIALYIHISCLIERLVVKDYIEELSNWRENDGKHKHFIELAYKAFEEISSSYKVQVPVGEIQIIYQIIDNALKI